MKRVLKFDDMEFEVWLANSDKEVCGGQRIFECVLRND